MSSAFAMLGPVMDALFGKPPPPPPAPEPEVGMLPMAVAVFACWVVPVLLMQFSKALPPANAKVGINGFGRIGRLTFRFAWDMPEIDLVHVNVH